MVEHIEDGVRLQKVLASAGVGSRRHCEDLIAAGRITVNGEKVTGQGLRVDPSTAAITVDGKRVHAVEGALTLMLNKPKGVVSTMSDPQGRPSLDRYVADAGVRLFHVGRLDADTTGILLLTNDGALAQHLAHPSHGVPKTYVAKVSGRVPKGLSEALRAGITLEDGRISVDSCRVLASGGDVSVIEVVLHEGRNRIVRRMFEAIGHPVIELSRTKFGPITLGGLATGRTRVLDSHEVGALLDEAGL